LHWRIAIALVAAGLTAATPTQTKKKTTTAVHKTAPKKSTATRRTRRTLTAHAAKPPVGSTGHSGQTAPTPDRYKEIQQALVQKGYLHGEPSGQWNQDSMEALRRFQHDQNLAPSGKLDSLSLIALGLGPKH
jgi:hypothetical protein